MATPATLRTAAKAATPGVPRTSLAGGGSPGGPATPQTNGRAGAAPPQTPASAVLKQPRLSLALTADLATADGAPEPAPTNVIVGVRIRNLSQRERDNGDVHSWHADPIEQAVWLDEAFVDRSRRSSVPTYRFDYVLLGSANAPVYSAVAADVVWAAMDGLNGTIFAYGQTNSGKTYTMLGTDAEPGIIPQAINDVFRYIRDHPTREFLLRASYLEIYNETINDLLAPEQKNLQIHESKQRGIYVVPLREEIVTTPADILKIVRKGERTSVPLKPQARCHVWCSGT